MKVANWNIEWMNHWFTADRQAPALRPSDQIDGVSDINDLCARVAHVIDDLGADVLTIQEGPSRLEEMELFVAQFLDNRYQVLGPAGKGQQKLYALIRNNGSARDASLVEETGGVRFDQSFPVDVDADLEVDDYEMTREPLLFEVTDEASGKRIHMLNLHLKSKYVHKGERLWQDEATRPEFVQKALLARRRISAEAMYVRAYLDELLDADIERPVIVAGDLNDGPGSDYFERHYLTHNVAGMIAGSPFDPPRMFRHGFIDREARERNFTAIFDDFIDDIDNRPILLDHIFCSPGIYWDLADGRVEHEVYEAQVDAASPAGSRQHLPSDHRPQSVSF